MVVDDLFLVNIVVVSGGFVGGEDLLTKGFLHFSNKMAVLVLRRKWPQSEVLQRQLLTHLKTHFPLIFRTNSLSLNTDQGV